MNNPYHSKELRKYFDISPFGIDWYNPFDIPIEFKETFSTKDINKIIIKISNNQLLDSDFIVICYNHCKFFVHNSKDLKKRYNQINNCNLTSIRFTSLKRNYVFKTNNYDDLKKYLINLK